MKRILSILLVLVLLCACSSSPEPVAEEPTPEPAATAELIEIDLQTAVSDAAELITPEPTEEPTATPDVTEEPTPTPDGLCGGRFPDKFSDTPVKGERSYKSKNIGIEITRYENNGVYGGQLVYFVVDIYLQDVTSIRTHAASGDFAKGYYTRLVKEMAQDVGALIAINGDIYPKKAVVVRDGVTYRKKNENKVDLCVLLRDGSMQTFIAGKYQAQDILDMDAWQVWAFGPALFDSEGNPRTSFPDTSYRRKYEQPRTAFGYIEPGHYCWVVVDGRQPGYSDGIKMVDLARLMKDLGCQAAYNLDGGGSSVLYWEGEYISKSCNEARTVTDIIYILPEE